MGNTQIIKHTKQNKHNVIISERSHLPGAKFVEMFTFDCGNTVFLSSKIVTVFPKNQAERFCQGVRPLLNE